MFAQTWREYWGLKEDPFTCEDADKDAVLSELDPSMVHWSFDRMYGNPKSPAPGIVFGEKGSGKSALRLMMHRRIQTYNAENPDTKIFPLPYIDFNTSLHQFRKSIGARNDQNAPSKVMARWTISDHLDSILSSGVSAWVNEVLQSSKDTERFNHKERLYLAAMTALYYNSSERTSFEATRQAMKRFSLNTFRPFFLWFTIILLSLFSISISLLPLVWPFLEESSLPGSGTIWLFTGLAGLGGTWIGYFYHYASVRAQAARASRAIKVLPRNSTALIHFLEHCSAAERREFVLPLGSDESTRYHMMQWFLTLLERTGYSGLYVLMDRIDEPSLLSSEAEYMRAFVESILDIKFLQFPGLGLKLFLPIELDELHRNATPEQLKKMRLDKSNLVPELKWSGQELYEIANMRFRTISSPDGKAQKLIDLFADDFDFDYLKESLTSLGTPRYAFSFLSALFSEYIKELPNDMEPGDPRWSITRSQFDIVRASWLDRSGMLRRVLN